MEENIETTISQEETPVNDIQNVKDDFVDDSDTRYTCDKELHDNLEKYMDGIVKNNIENRDLSDFGINIETYENAFKNSLIDRIHDIASEKLE